MRGASSEGIFARLPIPVVTLIFLVLGGFCAQALDPSRTLFQYNCQTWTPQNGLPANAVSAITQTRDGYMWLGTAQGLVRFDGSDFKLFDISGVPHIHSTIVTSLANSRDGGFWFGFERGAFGHFDGMHFTSGGNDALGGANLNVQALLETRSGDLWIAAETLAARINGTNHYDPVLSASGGPRTFDVMSVYEDSQHRIWLGTARQGLFYWHEGKLSMLDDPAVNGRIVRCVVEDKQGQIWVGTETGFVCFDSQFKRRTDLPATYYETRVLLVDRHGAVWIGTTAGGLVRYLNNELSRMVKQDGLADDFVTALAEDEEGSIWIGTRNGLSQLSDIKIPTLTRSEGLRAQVDVAVTASHKGGLWIATDESATYFDRAQNLYPTNFGLIFSSSFERTFSPDSGRTFWTNFPASFSMANGLSDPYIKNILEARNGDLYVVNGVMAIEIVSRGKVVARYPNHTWPSAMTEDDRGVLVSIGGEFYRVGPNFFEPYPFAQGNKPPVYWVFNMITGRDGAVWASTGDGLCRIKNNSYTLWSVAQGMPDNKVTWVCEDEDGVIWAGTEKGITRIKKGRLRTISRAEGLLDNIIYVIVPDDHGDFWIDSSRGFFCVSRRELNAVADGKARHVQCQGFSGLEAVKTSEHTQQQQSGCKTRDGRIWFPTALGVVMIDPTNVLRNPVPPKVHIQVVRANDKEMDPDSPAVVDPGKGELEFHYAGLSYRAPQKVRYRYCLKGYDANWVEAGPRRAAFYTNLKPGAYRFQVQACNEDGVWTTIGAEVPLNLLPHYYQAAWFHLLMIALAGFSLLGLYGWRVKRLTWKQQQLQTSNDLLETKVQERTRELQNEIEERKRIQIEVDRIHRELVDASRLAGQAEVASSMLHNVGNVLNSLNVSASIISDQVKRSKADGISRIAKLLDEHRDNMAEYLSQPGRLKKIISYLKGLSNLVQSEQTDLLKELHSLTGNIEHIKAIIVTQQNYARVLGVRELHSIPTLVEDALRVHSNALKSLNFHVTRRFEPVPDILVDKHKVLQILVNLISNAKHALDLSKRSQKELILQVSLNDNQHVRIAVSDNGVGIRHEHLTRIFTHGFTTRPDGHGLGLHSGILAAREMGGTLLAESDGPGCGATFTLEIPIDGGESQATPAPVRSSLHPPERRLRKSSHK